MSGFSIIVKAGPDAASSSVSASGSVQHIITDEERSAFGITDGPLKNAVGKYFGKNPDDAYLHSDTPWGDLYRTYGWPQVQTVLVLESATITGITATPEIIARNDFKNQSSVAGNFNASVSTQISNTESSNWSQTSTISFKETVSFNVGFEGLGQAGSAVEWGFSESFGVGGSQSKTVTVGSTQGVTVLLQPGQSVEAQLSSIRGTMKIRVVYRAYLIGDTAINYGGTYKGHHFWALPIDGVMAAAGISNSITITQDIQIGYYCNASVLLVNPQGVKVEALRAVAAHA